MELRIYRYGSRAPVFGFLFSFLICLLSAAPALATNPPVITPGTGVYSTVQATATITGDAGATFNYTTDGSNPTLLSPTYSSPITLGDTNTIKAIATVGGVTSSVTTAYIQNDPTTFPVPRTNLGLWLKPEFITVSAGKVSQWSDLSGSSNDATQATGTNQPSQVTNSLFGYQAVSFGGTNSYMSLPSFLTNLTSGLSIFTVISPNTSSAAKTVITASPSAASVNDLTALEINSTTVTFKANNGATTGSIASSSGAVATTKYQILDVVHSGAATASMRVNSNDIATTGTIQNLANTARSVAYIGTDKNKTSGTFFGGKVAEMLVYTRAVTSTERSAIEAYLSNKYQFGQSTATAAPVFSTAAGTLSTQQYVAIYAPPGATVYFTVDGTTPVAGTSPVYSSPINIAWTQTLKAIAVANGITSSTTSATYTLSDTVLWPAPSATTTPLNINLQLPTTAIPQ